MGTRRVDILQIFFLLLVQLPEHAVCQDLGETDDRVQRRSQLVGHIRQELRLVLAGDFELMTLVRELPKEAGVLDGESRLGGKGSEKPDDLRRELAGRLVA